MRSQYAFYSHMVTVTHMMVMMVRSMRSMRGGFIFGDSVMMMMMTIMTPRSHGQRHGATSAVTVTLPTEACQEGFKESGPQKRKMTV
jgi:hypothetical protein